MYNGAQTVAYGTHTLYGIHDALGLTSKFLNSFLIRQDILHKPGLKMQNNFLTALDATH